MQIVVNGENKEVAQSIKIGRLLKELGIQDKTMASAVNMEVIKKEHWDSYELKEGDKVEFLQFVGGG